MLVVGSIANVYVRTAVVRRDDGLRVLVPLRAWQMHLRPGDTVVCVCRRGTRLVPGFCCVSTASMFACVILALSVTLAATTISPCG